MADSRLPTIQQGMLMASIPNDNKKRTSPAGFQCAVCSRAFSRPDHLARHARSHSNVRPFRCEVCGRLFGRRDVLLRHADQVHRRHSAKKKDASSLQPARSDGGPMLTSKRQQLEENSPALHIVKDASTTPSFKLDDCGIGRVASLQGADFEDFLGRLSTISSYPDLAQLLASQSRSSLYVGKVPIHSDALGYGRSCEISIPYTPSSLQVLSTHQIPSLSQSVFDQLLHSYKENFPLPWVHFPTLDLSSWVMSGNRLHQSQPHASCHGWKRRPHRILVISMLALGASCCQESALALDLYQQTRRGILDWLSQAREEPLPLQFFQAFINYLAFGITFGDKSLEQLTVGHTISLRRLVIAAALDKPQNFPDQGGHVCGCGCCGHKDLSKWIRWAKVEERKRTFFAYFSALSSTLMYLDSIASVDWREVGYDLPCNEQVWLAGSLSDWEEAFRQEPGQPLFTQVVQSLFERDAGAALPTSESEYQSSDGPLHSHLSCFLLIAAVHWEGFHARTQPGSSYHNVDGALERWRVLWKQTCAEKSSKIEDRFFGCTIAMFNHTQLLLQADINEARKSLASREFRKFHISFLELDPNNQRDSSINLPTAAGNHQNQLIDGIFFRSEQRSAFRNIAHFSLDALKMSAVFDSKESCRMNMSLHVGASMFYFIQCLCSWICFFAHCLDRGLYASEFEWDNSADLKDVRLLESILAFAQNRKTEFNASFEILSSPDDFDRNKAGRLACSLLDLYHHIFSECRTWPLLGHVGDALKGRSLAISDWIDGS